MGYFLFRVFDFKPAAEAQSLFCCCRALIVNPVIATASANAGIIVLCCATF